MYRCSDNSAICYTPEDLALFRESPFASWMERLTLENPGHGIAPDQPTTTHLICDSTNELPMPGQSVDWADFVNGVSVSANPLVSVQQVNVAQVLGLHGVSVHHIAAYDSERMRHAATLRAMRSGTEYIANAQLRVGPLSCTVDLLVKGNGISDLGSFIYLPASTDGNPANLLQHRLCFAADLLQSEQGVLPAQLLVIAPGEEMSWLATQDYIARYLDLKHSFMRAQLAFRKHVMPDPAKSKHFGRWSGAAHEALRGRSSSEGHMQWMAGGSVEDLSTRRWGKGLVAALNDAVATSEQVYPGSNARSIQASLAGSGNGSGSTKNKRIATYESTGKPSGQLRAVSGG